MITSPTESAARPYVHSGDGATRYLAFAAFVLISVRETFLVPGTFGRSIAEALIAGAIILWALDQLRGAPRIGPSRELTLVILTYTIASLASFAANQGELSNAEQDASVNFIVFNLTLVAMIFMVFSWLRSVTQVVTVLKGLVAGGALSATFALIEFSTGWDAASRFTLPGLKEAEVFYHLLVRDGVVRAQGSAIHPLELAAVLMTLVPVAVGLLSYVRTTGGNSVPWTICAALIMLGALVTVSRTVFIGVAASLLVMAWRWPVRRLLYLLGGVVVVFAIGLLLQIKLLLAFVSSFAGASTDPSLISRQVGQTYVLARYRDNLLFGHGAGTYPVDDSHPVLDNEYLTRLFDTGLIGIASYAALLGVVLYICIRVSASRSDDIAALGSGLAGSVVALIFAGGVLDLSGFSQIWYLVWFILALGGVIAKLSNKSGLT